MRLDRQIFDRLPGVGEADAHRVGQSPEGPVVVAAPLPQAAAVGVERQQGGEDQIRRDRRGQRKRSLEGILAGYSLFLAARA